MEQLASVSAIKRSRTVPVGGGGREVSSVRKQMGVVTVATAGAGSIAASALVGIESFCSEGALVGAGFFCGDALVGVEATRSMFA